MWTPITILLSMHPVDIQLSLDDCSFLGKLHEQMYLRNHAMLYPLGLHISVATDINMVTDKVCPRLPVWDDAKKKGFELYYKDEVPMRKIKVEIMNYPRSWSLPFHGKQLICTPNAYDVRTF